MDQYHTYAHAMFGRKRDYENRRTKFAMSFEQPHNVFCVAKKLDWAKNWPLWNAAKPAV